MNPPTRPALGETVHYVGSTGECKAAMVVGHSNEIQTGRWPTLHLRVLTITACFPASRVPFSQADRREDHTWHWGCGRG